MSARGSYVLLPAGQEEHLMVFPGCASTSTDSEIGRILYKRAFAYSPNDGVRRRIVVETVTLAVGDPECVLDADIDKALFKLMHQVAAREFSSSGRVEDVGMAFATAAE